MKLLVLFFVAAAWLQLPAEGRGIRSVSSDFSQFINRRGNLLSIEESEVDSNDSSDESTLPTASDAVKAFLREEFGEDSWRSVVLALASPETMADPEFRAKWRVTTEDDKEKEDVLNNLTESDLERLATFLSSSKWKGVFALSSTKEDLMDPKYRKQWHLDFNVDIENTADDDGNFFEGAQWKVFLEYLGIEVNDSDSDWDKAAILMPWIVELNNVSTNEND